MSDAPEQDQKTEAPTPKRRQDAARKGDVLQSRELGTALVLAAGALWLLVAGHWMIGALSTMLVEGLSFDVGDVRDFRPGTLALRMIAIVLLPLFLLFGLTFAAAVAAPALLGSLGFRSGAMAFKAEKLNPLSGMKRIFGMNGLVELAKSLAKVLLVGAVGTWLMFDQARMLIGLGAREIGPAIASIGWSFTVSMLVLTFALVLVAMVDVPAQMFQRLRRLRMSKQEVKEEHKQTEGSPELKAAVRRRQHEVLRNSARSAVAEATVVLTNPTHFAVALRYRPGEDAAPVVVARGRGATAEAIRSLAGEASVPILSYPQLARAIYFTARPGQVIREDLYLAVATVLAFVFNLDATLASGAPPPKVDLPPGARFDERGRPDV